MPYMGEIGDVLEIANGEVFSMEWKIPDVFSLSRNGDRYQSPDFHACGARWAIVLYPNGSIENSAYGWVDLFLFRADGDPPRSFKVTLGVKGAEGVVEHRKERSQELSLEGDEACVWFRYCRTSKLKDHVTKLLQGNSLTFSIDFTSAALDVARDCKESSTQTEEDCKEVKVNTEEIKFVEKQGLEELAKSLHKLLESKRECDVVIKVRDKEFPAHRLILQARSTVLEAMFGHDMVEKQGGIVNMEDTDPETFPDFLEHVYTGSVGVISPSNVFNLYATSDKYGMAALKQGCLNFLMNNMTVASFCEVITLAVRNGDKALTERATEFFCNNSTQIVKTPGWKIFLTENATLANELFMELLSKHEDVFRAK